MEATTLTEIRTRIEAAAKELGINAVPLIRRFGVTSELANMPERLINKEAKWLN